MSIYIGLTYVPTRSQRRSEIEDCQEGLLPKQRRVPCTEAQISLEAPWCFSIIFMPILSTPFLPMPSRRADIQP